VFYIRNFHLIFYLDFFFFCNGRVCVCVCLLVYNFICVYFSYTFSCCFLVFFSLAISSFCLTCVCFGFYVTPFFGQERKKEMERWVERAREMGNYCIGLRKIGSKISDEWLGEGDAEGCFILFHFFPHFSSTFSQSHRCRCAVDVDAGRGRGPGRATECHPSSSTLQKKKKTKFTLKTLHLCANYFVVKKLTSKFSLCRRRRRRRLSLLNVTHRPKVTFFFF